MKKAINTIWLGLLGSLDTKKNTGFSARKLTSITVMLCVVAAHIKWIALGNFHQLEMVLTIDYAFVAALLGMTTYQNIKSNENSPTNNNDTTN
jgi:hypothetical protein